VPSVVKRILFILSYFIRCNEVYENTESRTRINSSILTTSASSESIFSNELDDNNDEQHRFEDKIVRHLTGDVESIAIPRTTTYHHTQQYASSSIGSSNSIKSSSNKWFSDNDERPWSPDPFVIGVSSSPSSSSLELLPSLTVSPSGSFQVAMPK
jgi:hypothetical protein